LLLGTSTSQAPQTFHTGRVLPVAQFGPVGYDGS
jgi:hypothetical protein